MQCVNNNRKNNMQEHKRTTFQSHTDLDDAIGQLRRFKKVIGGSGENWLGIQRDGSSLNLTMSSGVINVSITVPLLPKELPEHIRNRCYGYSLGRGGASETITLSPGSKTEAIETMKTLHAPEDYVSALSKASVKNIRSIEDNSKKDGYSITINESNETVGNCEWKAELGGVVEAAMSLSITNPRHNSLPSYQIEVDLDIEPLLKAVTSRLEEEGYTLFNGTFS